MKKIEELRRELHELKDDLGQANVLFEEKKKKKKKKTLNLNIKILNFISFRIENPKNNYWKN